MPPLRTTSFGDDKDRVMRKRDGLYTYFVPDVAYHLNKWQRGFGRVITISSGAGQPGIPLGISTYGAGKGGAISFMRHLAMEVAGQGVTANSIALWSTTS